MPLWTLFGLAQGQGDDRLAAAGRTPLARRACSACRASTPSYAIRMLRNAPRSARPTAITSRPSRAASIGLPSITAAASSASSASKPVRPARSTASFDWAFGVREPRTISYCPATAGRSPGKRDAAQSRRGFPPQPAYPPRRRRLLQRLRVGAAGAEQSLLQSASVRNLLHAVAALRRSASCHRTSDLRDA